MFAACLRLAVQYRAEWQVQLEQAALREQGSEDRNKNKDKKHKRSKHKKHSKKDKKEKKEKHHKKHKHSKHKTLKTSGVEIETKMRKNKKKLPESERKSLSRNPKAKF